MRVSLLTRKSQKNSRVKIVASAGKLSRFPGKVTEVYRSCVDPVSNQKFIERVISMGHD